MAIPLLSHFKCSNFLTKSLDYLGCQCCVEVSNLKTTAQQLEILNIPG